MKHLFFQLVLFAICFSAFSQAPTITSFSPSSGPVGTLVTITGTNINSPDTLAIGNTPLIVLSATTDTLVGMIMPGSITGSISLSSGGIRTTSVSSFIVTPTLFPEAQQGPKLVALDAIGSHTSQGQSVSISADGNTVIVGGNGDNGLGAAWIYNRRRNIWIESAKLIGVAPAGSGYRNQGWAVAISADGNTALVSATESRTPNNISGIVYVFTRSDSIWTQEDQLLVPGSTAFGIAVALSADGNTAIVGGLDNYYIGSAWIFNRYAGSWTQISQTLQGRGALGVSDQGAAVAISADGNTVIIGGPGDSAISSGNSSAGAGAAWIFSNSGGYWSQQGNKLVGTGAVGIGSQGMSVSISADGNTAAVGGDRDNNDTGAVWIYTRSGGLWSQQGLKLIGTGSISAEQGSAVSLSADGNTLAVGAFADSSLIGAIWIFSRIDTSWIQRGSKLVGTGSVYFPIYQGRSIALSADGSTVVEGGNGDNSDIGAAWIFNSTCSTYASMTYDTISHTNLPYIWNGLTFNGAGIQTAYLRGSQGCDSAVTLALTVSPTGISEINSSSLIHLYPNPNKGSFTLQTLGSIGSEYTISDMLGHIISRQTIKSDSQQIELPDAGNGMYIIANQGVSPTRFVIMR